MENRGIGISHLPNQRYRTFCKNGVDYNIMIIGARGSGKTTFMNMLLNTKLLLDNPYSPKNSPKMSNLMFRESTVPFSIIQTPSNQADFRGAQSLVNFQITDSHFIEKKFNIRLSITEVDGVGDRVDNNDCWEPIVTHINDMFSDFRLQEKENVRNLIRDRRIHVCLYFIDSTLVPIRNLDVRIMKEISQYCNLIPIVSRSDVLTEKEIECFYSEIRNRLFKDGITFCDPRSAKSLRTITENCPFFIVSAKRNDKKKKFRKLEYGTIDLDSEWFGDLIELKKILIEEHMLDLIESTDYYYEIYRANYLTKQLYEEGGWSEDEIMLMNEFSEKFKNSNDEYYKKHLQYLARKSELEQEVNINKNSEKDDIEEYETKSIPMSVKTLAPETGPQSAR